MWLFYLKGVEPNTLVGAGFGLRLGDLVDAQARGARTVLAHVAGGHHGGRELVHDGSPLCHRGRRGPLGIRAVVLLVVAPTRGATASGCSREGDGSGRGGGENGPQGQSHLCEAPRSQRGKADGAAE